MFQSATFTVGISVAMMPPRFVTWGVQIPGNTERDHQGAEIGHNSLTSLPLPQVFWLEFALL